MASLCALSAVCQSNIIVPSDHLYLYQETEYDFTEIGSIFGKKPEIAALYSKGRKLIRAGNITTYVGFGMLALGGGIYFASSSDNFKVASCLTFGIGLILELVANIPRALGKKKIKKVIRKFNLEVIEREGYNSFTTPARGGNTIGIVYRF